MQLQPNITNYSTEIILNKKKAKSQLRIQNMFTIS